MDSVEKKQIDFLKERIEFEPNVFGDYLTYTKVLNNLLEDSKHIALSLRFPYKDYSNIKIKDGVFKLEQMAIAEKENESHHLSLAMNVLLAQEISCINGEIINAYTDLSLYAYTNIIGAIKSKLLNIFKELEKQYGNLDEYYIDFKDKKKEEKVAKSLITIIYDKSTHIGNNNTIKESIIGDNNEN